MKRVISFTIAAALLASTAFADQYVNGYTRRDGTYVQGYTRSDRDSSYNNNYSTQGNQNPYTGEYGSNSRTYNDRTPEYNTRTYGNPGYERSNSSSSYGSNSLYRGLR